MDKANNKIDLEEKIFRSIETKKIKMRPRWEFLAEKIGLESALVLTFLLIATLFSLLFLYSRANEIHRLLEFGPDGWWYLLKSFPFELFLIIATLIYLLNTIAKKLEYSYKLSRFYWYGLLALSLLVLVIAAEAGGLHRTLSDFEEGTELPLLKPYFNSRIQNIVHESDEGDIIEANDNQIILQTVINHRPTTTIIRRTNFNFGHNFIKKGDHVRVLGKPCQAELKPPCLIYKKAAPAKVQ